mmetsp:Transcript_138530/g.265906  ORF Transcript_138530/g.265906 Transcript_138530/m.265906 type:complete len:868 (-) Transcript_138530:52-2655(-)
MATNGFEQMFINLTNERIQKLFNDVVIQRELQIYSQEGILGAAMFNFNEMDNSECVRLFTATKPPGIVKLLSGQCQLGDQHDGAKFVQVLSKMIVPQECWKSYFKVCTPEYVQMEKKAKNLPMMPKYEECFVIRHYCTSILYTVQDFVQKSRDALLPHLHEVIAASTKADIKRLFGDNGLSETETVGEKFCGQLQQLAEVLDSGETCFVRCIKSNERKLPGTVNRPMVLEQLRHGGVVAALEMRRSGLPERMEYQSFNTEFEPLGRLIWKGVTDPVRCAKAIMQSVVGSRAVEGKAFAFGHNRVFMSTRIYQFLKAVVKMRWKHYAIVVVTRWRFAMNAVKIRDIEESWRRLQATTEFAREQGFASLPRVSKALQIAKRKLEPPYSKLEVEKLDHPLLGTLGENEKRKAYAKIAAAIGDWPGLKLAATAVEAEIQKVVERKAKAQEFRMMQVQKALDQLASLVEVIEKVEADCKELADVVEAGEMARCKTACESAQKAITAGRNDELPALREKIPACVDLNNDGPFEGDPEVSECLARVETVVREAESLGEEILRVRGQFLLVASEFEEQRVAKLQELRDLQTMEFVEEGLHEVVEPIDRAWQRSAVMDDLLKAAKDADAYRAAVEAFLADVDNAKRTVEKARETLEKAKRERAERQRLYTEVSEIKEKLAEARMSITETEIISDSSRELVKFCNDIPVLMEEGSSLFQADRGQRQLEEWRTDIEAWKQRSEVKLTELQAHRDKVSAERRSKFASRLAVFGDTPEKKRVPMASPGPSPQKKKSTGHTFGRSPAHTKISNEGLSNHSDKLLQIAALVEELQRSGADRGGVQSCLNHFVTNAYSGRGASVSISRRVSNGSLGSPVKKLP